VNSARNGVAIGGGTGLPVVLRCLLASGFNTSAVVTMADDGGSSGTLRDELGILPPGDIRNCLVAMSDPSSELASLFNFRFGGGGALGGHSLGNLMLAALAEAEGGFPEALAAAERLLGTRGHALPSTLCDARLYGIDSTGERIDGQAALAHGTGPITRVGMTPESPNAYPPTLQAIRDASVVVIAPGSLFTSILPNFLVDGVTQVMRDSSAKRVFVCNLANQRGETAGMDAADHVDALVKHGLEGCLDVVIVHRSKQEVPAGTELCDDDAAGGVDVRADDSTLDRIRAHGVEVVTADLVDRDNPFHHASDRLCRVLNEVL
jgi:uncharacterized cofD-like protein